uniref:C3H1-type domain-containing protein n=1 Tax=Kalanchoe fedtschenkoi TaxID=63787 RepID=A0A7N0TDC8_KALFE
MSFPESQSPFVPPGLGASSDAIQVSFWQQYSINNQDYNNNAKFQQPRPPKRPREEENQSDNVVIVPQRMPSSSIPVNKGITNIFFKTRVCAKFKLGLCRNGENCNFAHGVEDLRQPPPNWQELVGGREEDRGSGNWDDEQRIALKMKLCKKFSNGEVCPYGDRCNFLHEDPKRLRDDSDSVRFRESSAIHIGSKVNTAAGHGSGLDLADANLFNTGSDAYRMNVRIEHWKTKLCCKFEANGFCSFGDKCGFAHGRAELQGPVVRPEGELRSCGAFNTSMNPVVGPPNDISSGIVDNAILNEEQTGKKDFSKLKGSKKINRIYADWIDDLPLDAP